MSEQLSAGGTERQLTELSKNFDRSLFQPHVAYIKTGVREPELRAAGVELLHVPMQSFASCRAVGQAARLGRFIRTRRIVLAHAFDYPMACFGAPVARTFRTPVVLTSQRASRKLNPPLYQRLQRITDTIVDGIVANCDAARRHLIDDEHVPPSAIRICHNGIDITRFRPVGPIRRHEVADASLVVGTVCVLRPEKGTDVLLKAFGRIGYTAAGVRLAIIGSGPMRESLQTLAGELHLSGCVFRPAVEDVTEWLHSIDIFVLPSRSEAFSNSLMEAMACGCAVIASDTGGNPELVHDGETGLLFQPDDADDLAARLRLLIDDPTMRARLGQCASRFIHSRFSIGASVARMQEIYLEFLTCRGAVAGGMG